MFSSFSVKKPYTVVVAVIIIAILGVVSLTNMSTDLLPSMNLPYAVVITTYGGASPEEVEMAVTRPIEQSMASISNIKNVSSVSQEHMSIVILEFGETTNMDSAVIEMRENLDMIKGYMPDQVSSPMIMKLNPDMMPLMVASAAVEGQSISEFSPFLENTIIPELESVEGVASVSTSGLIEEQIHVILRDEKINEVNEQIKVAMLASMGLTPEQLAMLPPGQGPQVPEIQITKEMVSGILKGQNFSMPAGYIIENDVDYLIRTGDKIRDLDELNSLTVMTLPLPGIEPIKLQDVAEVLMINSSGDSYSKVNGNDAVTITFQKQTEYTTADVAKSLRDKFDDVMAKNEGLQFVTLMDQGEYIGIVVNSISLNLIIGAVLAILILLIFLRDFKPTIIVGFAIPVSLVTAFVMMYFGNITLNIISMGGLALGVGMLVDNSIVVIENIYRMRNEGKEPKEAAIEGAKQVAGAIMASTLTTVAVFVPILFTQGFTRQIFSDMGLTIAFSLFASLIVALTLVPMMASNMLVKNIQKEHKFFDKFKGTYTKLLNFSLNHKWLVILTVLILFVGSIAGSVRMGTELFPSADSGQISVRLSMPSGTMFDDMTKVADEVTKIIMEIEEVETVGASIGGGMMGMGALGMGGSGGESISFNITLSQDRNRSTDEVIQVIRDQAQSDDYELTVDNSGMDMAAMAGAAVEIQIRGREFDTLETIAKDIAEIVASVEGTIDIDSGVQETAPEMRFIVDKDKSIAKGLTVAQVFMEINSVLANETATTTLTLGSKDYELFVKDEAGRENISIEDILELSITTPQGESVQIKEIVNVEEARGFASIRRTNQQRYITVTAALADGYNVGLVNNEISDKLSDYNPPEGYIIDMGGESEMIRESFKDLFLMLILGVAFIYLIMVAQFQSLLSPFIVMFTIPLAFTGGFIGLMVTRSPISIVAMIGLIVLAGVVVNNGIVFVDYINKMREEGMSKRDAIVKAGNDRIRPILMTALTTIFALSTMSVGAGEGTEMMQPLAITATGGLIYATLLTLVLIPVLYDSFHRKDEVVVKGGNNINREI
ncbi:efflux RND transporter permease subunit [Alkaliphilus transvaalensis]|uniref:efflux RND transporter permease subunit n=1 Tax=Alkaliphilus transvaalensis TaxID=114628 RepID=UPI00047A31B4|nr:efflux RND transporter permease subunit [Alkaliphilus transvaalensis]